MPCKCAPPTLNTTGSLRGVRDWAPNLQPFPALRGSFMLLSPHPTWEPWLTPAAPAAETQAPALPVLPILPTCSTQLRPPVSRPTLQLTRPSGLAASAPGRHRQRKPNPTDPAKVSPPSSAERMPERCPLDPSLIHPTAILPPSCFPRLFPKNLSRPCLLFLSHSQVPRGPAGQARAYHSTPDRLQELLTPRFPPAHSPTSTHTAPSPHLPGHLVTLTSPLSRPPSLPLFQPPWPCSSSCSLQQNTCDVPLARSSCDSWVGSVMLVTIMRTLGGRSGTVLEPPGPQWRSLVHVSRLPSLSVEAPQPLPSNSSPCWSLPRPALPLGLGPGVPPIPSLWWKRSHSTSLLSCFLLAWQPSPAVLRPRCLQQRPEGRPRFLRGQHTRLLTFTHKTQVVLKTRFFLFALQAEGPSSSLSWEAAGPLTQYNDCLAEEVLPEM